MLDFPIWILYNITMMERHMKEEIVKRESYWIVELSEGNKVLYYKQFRNFESAFDKYQFLSDKDYHGRMSVMLQRRFREYKVA